jgi:4-diphosphocytidyl-2-C-methyl-D-erythritol kinase
MSSYRALAPAKINLGLFVGPPRTLTGTGDGDARHELVSVMQSISLADQLTLEPAPAQAHEDELICPGLPGPPAENLAARALRAFRAATGWDSPPLRLSIEKRIPVAAGLGGGSADAAAALRLASHASGLGDDGLLRRLGAELGADVPAQITPGRWLARGAGEVLAELPPPRSPLGVLLLADAGGLSTAAVYTELDRLGVQRTRAELERWGLRLSHALEAGAPLPGDGELLANDLQRAAISLHPPIADTLAQVQGVGAQASLVSGSGPTVIALFAAGQGAEPDAAGGDQLQRAERAASTLTERLPAPICASAVAADFAAVRTLERSGSAPA